MYKADESVIVPINIDSETCFFVPKEFISSNMKADTVLQRFMHTDIFTYRGGILLPQNKRFQEVLKFAKTYLMRDKTRLSRLHFHNESHTFHPVKGVISVALKLAIIDGFYNIPESYERIGLAAALHDIGNIVQRQKHEQISIDDSHQLLKELGYEQQSLEAIADCIRSTEIDYRDNCPARKVLSREAKIVSDADLSNVGFCDVTNFAFESIKLWLELEQIPLSRFAQEGPDFTLRFFTAIGDFYTGAARFLFSNNRRKNMQVLRRETTHIMTKCAGNLSHLMTMIQANDDRIAASATLIES